MDGGNGDDDLKGGKGVTDLCVIMRTKLLIIIL